MRFKEVEDAFRKGFAVKRKSWEHCIVFVAKDSLNFEDYLADDWEICCESEKIKKQVEIYNKCCISIMNNHLKEMGSNIEFVLSERNR